YADLFGPDSPPALTAALALADACFSQNKRADAARRFRQVIDEGRERDADPAVRALRTRAFTSLGRILYEQGDWAAAEPALYACPARGATLGKNHGRLQVAQKELRELARKDQDAYRRLVAEQAEGGLALARERERVGDNERLEDAREFLDAVLAL